jgi:hypothetical protein
MKIVKIGNVELTENEARNVLNNGKYIVTYSKVYQLHCSDANETIYGSVVYNRPTSGGVGLVKRGCFITASADHVNQLIGVQLLRA